MEFSFRYKVKPQNVWVLGMVNMYRSMAGVVNIIFTLSMVLLALRFWTGAAASLKILIAAGILIFPVFQPLLIYLRSRKIVSRMPSDLKMTIDDKGIEVASEDNRSHIDFSDLKSILKIRGLLVLHTHSQQSFILNGETLEGQGEKLYSFLSQASGGKK